MGGGRFLGLRVLLILMREQLQRDQVPEEVWIDLLECYRTTIAKGNLYPGDNGKSLLFFNYMLPMLRVLAGHRRLTEALTDQSDSQNKRIASSRVYVLFTQLGLGLLLAEPLERFSQLLEALPTLSLLRMCWPQGFAERYPAAGLFQEQLIFERCQVLDPKLETPEALAWYRQIIDQVPGNSDGFEEGMALLAKHASEKELDELIRAFFLSGGDRRLPSVLVERVSDVAHLSDYLGAIHNDLPRMAACRLFDLASVRADSQPAVYLKDPHNWAVLLTACERYPGPFIQMTLDAAFLPRDSLERWALLWHSAENDQQRLGIVQACFTLLAREQPQIEALELAERLFADNQQPFRLYVEEQDPLLFDKQIAALGQHDSPLLALVAEMAVRYLQADTYELKQPLAMGTLCRALAAFPQSFSALEERDQIRLLALFDDTALLACAEELGQLFGSRSKAVRDPAVALIARSSPQAIERSGLLGGAPLARLHVLTGMGLAQHPDMAALVALHFKDAAHNDYSRGLSLDALERAGYAMQGLDPWAGLSLPALQAQAQGQKIPVAIDRLWNDEFATTLAPLGEALGRYLLFILSTSGELLPRRARQILAFLPAARCSDFVLLNLTHWIAENGSETLHWLLFLLPEHGDERAANALVKAAKDWRKTRKRKTNAAIRLLCSLPGTYGLAQVREMWESGKFSNWINQMTQQALGEAAERQGLGLAAFLEQLVPDFGMQRDGLKLDVGPYSYTVRIRPDLSLAVLDEKGKASKSLPKAKVGEDPDKRSLAENQFKALAKNLKPVLKQQGKRLTRGLRVGNSWPAETWRRVFAEHPLLAVIVQNVVWSAVDNAGQPLKRFRPNESGELLDLYDERYTLSDEARVHITHPLELDAAECEAWRAHFEDYQLVSPIEQCSTPVFSATVDELVATELARANGRILNRGVFGSLLSKWGYLKGAVEDSEMFEEHRWSLDGDRWWVTLRHSSISLSFDAEEEVEIEDFVVTKQDSENHEEEKQRLGDLPPALLNTLLDQAEQLRAVAEV